MTVNWNDPTNPIIKDWIVSIRQAEEIFDKKFRKKPQDLPEIFSEFNRFLYDNYFNNGLRKKYPILSYIYHAWENMINMSACSIISKFEERKLDNYAIEQIIRDVKLTSQMFEAWKEFGDNGEQSLSDIFKKAVGFGQAANTHQIVILGEELLSEIQFINTGHKAINFIIFLTLLENAKKYSPENSTITIEISKEDQITSDINDKEIEEKSYKYFYSVSDEGIGIPVEDQERIIRKGQRGSNVGEIPGTGSGLYLVYNLCNEQVSITSPLFPEAERFKGTKIKAELFNW